MSTSAADPFVGLGMKYTGKFYFVPEADNPVGDTFLMDNGQFFEFVSQMPDRREKVVRVYQCKNHLSLATSMLPRHKFVVLETENGWWWSLEKNTQTITVQRSVQV